MAWSPVKQVGGVTARVCVCLFSGTCVCKGMGLAVGIICAVLAQRPYLKLWCCCFNRAHWLLARSFGAAAPSVAIAMSLLTPSFLPPFMQLGMLSFMMYMAGTNLHLFSIMATINGLYQPLSAIIKSGTGEAQQQGWWWWWCLSALQSGGTQCRTVH